ncbi:MAG: oligopeptide/dipeptide ABC transporter ATP-binding protein [Actinomycetota bacterium]
MSDDMMSEGTMNEVTARGHLRGGDDVLLSVEDLVVEFPVARDMTVKAVSGVSFDLIEGETLGLVGESGCGKSTTAKALVQLPKPTSGTIDYGGTDLASLDESDLRALRSDIQMIFQDPIAALNPRRTVRKIVSEGLIVATARSSPLGWVIAALALVVAVIGAIVGWAPAVVAGLLGLFFGLFWTTRGIVNPEIGTFSDSRVDEILQAVGLDPDEAARRRPHEYSGGQCQRVAVARALVLDPKILICDEPVSALDVSVQAQILNMLEDMKERYGLTLLFISHDLSVIRNVSDRIAVMYLGKIVEIGDGDLLFADPAHHYTRVLLAALPDPTNPHRDAGQALSGELPSPIDPPSGCRFRTRCPRAEDICAELEPVLEQVADGDHWVACHFPVLTPH